VFANVSASLSPMNGESPDKLNANLWSVKSGTFESEKSTHRT
jgi:hypothetical protein